LSVFINTNQHYKLLSQFRKVYFLFKYYCFVTLPWKEPTRCDHEVEFIIPMFLNCSTCFGRHTTYHQKLKNCNCSLWFYIRFLLPAAAMAQPSQRPETKSVCKTRSCNYSFWAPDDGRCGARNMLSN